MLGRLDPWDDFTGQRRPEDVHVLDHQDVEQAKPQVAAAGFGEEDRDRHLPRVLERGLDGLARLLDQARREGRP